MPTICWVSAVLSLFVMYLMRVRSKFGLTVWFAGLAFLFAGQAYSVTVAESGVGRSLNPLQFLGLVLIWATLGILVDVMFGYLRSRTLAN